MNDVAKQTLLHRRRLDESQYFLSYLQQAQQLHLLTNQELETVQLQSLTLLARKTERYTFGRSSSVKIETAQDIFSSICFCIGVYLKNLPEVDQGIGELKEKPLAQLYELGRERVEGQTALAKRLLTAIQRHPLATKNRAYIHTVEIALPEFFAAYDADFAADQIPTMIDYPLSTDIERFKGIEYILHYLSRLYWENSFCLRYPARDVEGLLRGVHGEYQDLLVNIFELVLTSALGRVLAGRSARELTIFAPDRHLLQEKLSGLSKEELYALLLESEKQLCRELSLPEEQFIRRSSPILKNLPARIVAALTNDSLDRLFISIKGEAPSPTQQYRDNEKMPDRRFRALWKKIRACQGVQDKIALIQREVHSIRDLVDLMEADCLQQEEFGALFASLGDTELALVVKILPAQEGEDQMLSPDEIKPWQKELAAFLNKMDTDHRDHILLLSKEIALD